jgi:hypothetical protein
MVKGAVPVREMRMVAPLPWQIDCEPLVMVAVGGTWHVVHVVTVTVADPEGTPLTHDASETFVTR